MEIFGNGNIEFAPEVTVRYKTYYKTAIQEALAAVFAAHKDQILSRTKVTLDYPREDAELPCVIVRMHERDIQNFGVGHEEHIRLDGPDGKPESEGIFRFMHSLFHADIEYAVLALSSVDRDYVSDTVVQTLMMGKLEAYTNRFFERIYPDERTAEYPDAIWHTLAINSDKIEGGGETTAPTPWMSEDDLLYGTTYRTGSLGEFYSVPPDIPHEFVKEVLLLPYIGSLEAPPSGSPGAIWEPEF